MSEANKTLVTDMLRSPAAGNLDAAQPATLTDEALVPRALSEEERARFRRDGVLVVPGAVSRARLDAALRAIHASLGKGFEIEPHQIAFRDDLLRDPSVRALLTATCAWPLVEALLGKGKAVLLPDLVAQVLPRFPVPASAPGPREELFNGLEGWHVDGMSGDEPCPFTILVGFALSDTLEDGMGQLTVWPGSHHHLCDLVATRGRGVLDMAAPRPSLAPSRHVQLQLRAGDLVLAHPMVAHTFSMNYSPHIRHAVYYRIIHVDHERLRSGVPTNPWIMYEGL